MDKYFLSIVIPVYNVENYIGNTIESILRNPIEGVQVIIIDDGSTDRSKTIIKEKIEGINNFELYSISNNGVSNARNEGLLKSRGDYVYFLDGDDYISENFVSNLRDKLKDGSLDLVTFNYQQVYDFNGFNPESEIISFSLTGSIEPENMLNQVLLNSYKVWTGSIIYKRSFLIENSIEYTCGCISGEDQEFIFKALLKSDSLYHLNANLSFYLQRDTSISYSYNLKRFDSVAAMQRVKDFCSNDSIKYLFDFKTLEHFFYIFNSNVEALKIKKTNFISAVKKLTRDLSSLNDNSISSIDTIVKESSKYPGFRKKYKIYLFSPVLYYFLNSVLIRLNNRRR